MKMLTTQQNHKLRRTIGCIALIIIGTIIRSQENKIQQVPTDTEQSYNVYVIQLEDNGVNGPQVGCGDSVVPLTKTIPNFTGNLMQDAIQSLITLESDVYEPFGLYHALQYSTLRIGNLRQQDDTVTLELFGDISIGGVCDTPRVKAQIEQTLKQFSGVNNVQIMINNETFDDYFSLK